MSDAGSERSEESSDSVAWYERGNIETVFSGQEKQACKHVEICPNVDLVAMADERNVRLLRAMKWETIAEHKPDNENGSIISMQWSSDGAGLFLARSDGQQAVFLPDLPLSQQRLELRTHEAQETGGKCSSCELNVDQFFSFSQGASVPRLPDPEAASVAELPSTAPSTALAQVIQSNNQKDKTAAPLRYHLCAQLSPPSVRICLSGGFGARQLLLPHGVRPEAVAAGAQADSPVAVAAASEGQQHIIAYPSGTQSVSAVAGLCSVLDRDCSWLLAHASQAAHFAAGAWCRGVEPVHSSLDALSGIMAKQGVEHGLLGDTQLGILSPAALPVLQRSAAQLAALPAHSPVEADTPVPHTGILRHMLHAVAMGLPQLPGRLGLVQWLEGAPLDTLQEGALEATALVQFTLQQHVQPVLQWIEGSIMELRTALASHPCDSAQQSSVAHCDELLREAADCAHQAVYAVQRTVESSEFSIEALTSFMRVAQWSKACAAARAADPDASSDEVKTGSPGPGAPPLNAEHLDMLFCLAGTAAAEGSVDATAEDTPAANPFGIVFREDGGAAVAEPTTGHDTSGGDEDALQGGVHAKRLDPLLPCSVAAQCSSRHEGSVHDALQALAACVRRACAAIVGGLSAVPGRCVLQLAVSGATPVALAVAPPPADEEDEDADNAEIDNEAEDEAAAETDGAAGGESSGAAGSGSAGAGGSAGAERPAEDEVYVACPMRFTPEDPSRAPTNVLVVWRKAACDPSEGGEGGHAAGVELPTGSTVLACSALHRPDSGVQLFVLLRRSSHDADSSEGADAGSGGVFAVLLKCNELSFWPLAAGGPSLVSSVNDILVLDEDAEGGEGGGAAAVLSLGKAGVHEWGDVAEHCSEELQGWPAEHAEPVVALSAKRDLAVVRSKAESGAAPLWVLDIACDSDDDDEDDEDDDEDEEVDE